MKKILLLILLLLFSCKDEGIIPSYGCMNYNAENYDPNANVDDDSCIEEYYSWGQDIKQIFELCVACHDSHALTADYSSILLSGMIEDLNPETNDMFRRINLSTNDDEFMPLGYEPLSSDDIEKIRAWLLIGAPQ